MSRFVAPVGKTMPTAQRRLIEGRNLKLDPEAIMARLWAKENTREQIDFGIIPLDAILHECNEKCTEKRSNCSNHHYTRELNERDIRVVSATIQWLATNCGQELLKRFFKEISQKVSHDLAKK